MDPRLGQAAVRIGMFMALTAGALLFLVDRSSPEFVVSFISLAIGLAFMGAIALVVRGKDN